MVILHAINIIVFIGFCIVCWKKPGIALALLLFVSLAMFFSGLIYYEGEFVDEGVVVFILPLLLIPVAICLIHWSPSASSLETPWYKALTGAILTLFKGLVILAVFVLVFQFFSPIIFMLFLVGSYQYAQAQKYGLAMDVVSTIGASIRQSLPLPTALMTAAYGQKKKESRVFNNIAHWLTQGWSLSEAMRRGYPQCPSRILASITAAEKMDQLPKAIESLQIDLSEKVTDYKTARPIHPWYPVVILTFVFTIMLALAYYIIPTLAEILTDMSDGQASLPRATRSLLSFSNWLKGGHGSNILIILMTIICLWLFILYLRLRKRTPDAPRFLSRVGDWIKWHTPVLHWFEKTFGNLHLVQSLHVGLVAGYPVNTVLRNALALDVNRCYQKRLGKWLDKIEAGDDIAESAQAAGLDKTLAWAMDEKVNKHNAPAILESLEEVYRNNYNHRKNMLAMATSPLMVLGLGLTVGWVVYAIFIAMVSMLTTMLPSTIP